MSRAGVHDTLVNQLLTKIDGVDSLNNILLIGMTNRKVLPIDAGNLTSKLFSVVGVQTHCQSISEVTCELCCTQDMLDEALLRPGRLEVHVEIGLPDDKGRLQILKVRYPASFSLCYIQYSVQGWIAVEPKRSASGKDGTGNGVWDSQTCFSAAILGSKLRVLMQIHTNKMLENSFLGRDIDLWDLAGC